MGIQNRNLIIKITNKELIESSIESFKMTEEVILFSHQIYDVIKEEKIKNVYSFGK